MTVTVEPPDDLAKHENPAREALEALVLEAVRTEGLYRWQGAEMLGMGRLQFNDFLIQHGVTDHLYGVEDFLDDVRTGDRLRTEGKL